MTARVPNVGDRVFAIGPAAEGNGAEYAPAVITRVWSNTMVNVTVFPDMGVPKYASSAPLHNTLAQARENLPNNAVAWSE